MKNIVFVLIFCCFLVSCDEPTVGNCHCSTCKLDIFFQNPPICDDGSAQDVWFLISIRPSDDKEGSYAQEVVRKKSEGFIGGLVSFDIECCEAYRIEYAVMCIYGETSSQKHLLKETKARYYPQRCNESVDMIIRYPY